MKRGARGDGSGLWQCVLTACQAAISGPSAPPSGSPPPSWRSSSCAIAPESRSARARSSCRSVVEHRSTRVPSLVHGRLSHACRCGKRGERERERGESESGAGPRFDLHAWRQRRQLIPITRNSRVAWETCPSNDVIISRTQAFASSHARRAHDVVATILPKKQRGSLSRSLSPAVDGDRLSIFRFRRITLVADRQGSVCGLGSRVPYRNTHGSRVHTLTLWSRFDVSRQCCEERLDRIVELSRLYLNNYLRSSWKWLIKKKNHCRFTSDYWSHNVADLSFPFSPSSLLLFRSSNVM